MDLRGVVERYEQLAMQFGKPVALAGFGLNQAETEKVFSVFDEDYHISRYFHFSDEQGAGGGAMVYSINGFGQTHVSIDAEIKEAL